MNDDELKTSVANQVNLAQAQIAEALQTLHDTTGLITTDVEVDVLNISMNDDEPNYNFSQIRLRASV